MTYWTTLVGLIVGVMTLVSLVYGFTVFILHKIRALLIEEVTPIVQALTAPIVEEQKLVRQELREHMHAEQQLLARQAVEARDAHRRQDTILERVDEVKAAIGSGPESDSQASGPDAPTPTP